MIRLSNFYMFFYKICQMGLALLIMQFSYSLYEAKVFLLYNQLLFFVAVHTCITYPVQNGIWHKKYEIVWTGMIYGSIMTIFVTLLYFLVKVRDPSQYMVFVIMVVYLTYKFFERTYFNVNISEGRIMSAYKFTCLAALIELLFVFGGKLFVLWRDTAVVVDVVRFMTPSVVIAGIFLWIMSRDEALRSKISFKGNAGLFISGSPLIMHAACITLMSISDRFLIGFTSVRENVASGYLYYFSYAGAVYTFATAYLEVRRPVVIEVVKNDISSRELVTRSKFLEFVIVNLLIFAGAGVVGSVVFSFYQHDYKPALWLLCLLFFFILSVTAFCHLYFIGTEKYALLLATWLPGIILKVALYGFFSNVNQIMVLNVVGALVVLVVATVAILARKRGRNDLLPC